MVMNRRKKVPPKKKKKNKLLIFFLLVSPTFSQEDSFKEPHHFRPFLQIWGGPSTPFPGTKLDKLLNTTLSLGVSFRINLPWENLKGEAGISYHSFGSDTTLGLDVVPLYVAGGYPISLPIALELLAKLGGGSAYVLNFPELQHNFLPLLYHGWELSFLIKNLLRIGLRADYYFLYEGFVEKPPGVENTNLHMLGLYLMLGVYLSS